MKIQANIPGSLSIVNSIVNETIIDCHSSKLEDGTILVSDANNNIIGFILWNTEYDNWQMYINGVLERSNEDFEEFFEDERNIGFKYTLILNN